MPHLLAAPVPGQAPTEHRRFSGYRADIDGLRGIAVLAVVTFHAFPSIARSGFVGVDIFFVISGFLISGIILSEMAEDRFTYRSFYARRIKRIFPALATVLAATVAIGWVLLLPDEFKSLGEQVFGGAAFMANLVLWHQSGYFDQDASLKPLLHLWSLGIEEQFYLVWPAALAVALSLRRPVALVVAGLVASFSANLLFVWGHPDATFYLPVSRLWELLIGAAVAVAGPRVLDRGSALLGRHAMVAAQVTGGLALVIALLAIDEKAPFPGWWAVLPTCGTAMLIAAGPRAWINREILARRPLVFVGLISYPLYLWHWPLLAYEHILYGSESTAAVRVGLIIVSFGLAAVTYHVIEKPIRFGRVAAWPAALVTALGILAVGGGMMAKGLLSPHSAGNQFQPIWAAVADWQPFSGSVREETFRSLTVRVLEPKAPTRVLFFGDSNLEQFGPRIESVLTADPTRQVGAVVATLGGCAPIPKVLEHLHPDCPQFVADAMVLAGESRIDRVVVGACWVCYFRQDIGRDRRYSRYYDMDGIPQILGQGTLGNDLALTSLGQMLTRFAAQKPTFLILNAPYGPNADPKVMMHRSLRGITFDRTVLQRADLLAEYGDVRARLVEVARNAGAIALDPFDSLCPSDVCDTFTSQGEPLYRDALHMRPFFVREHASFIDQTMAPLTPPRATASLGDRNY